MKINLIKIIIFVFIPVFLKGQDIDQKKFIEEKIRETVMEKLRADPSALINPGLNNSKKYEKTEEQQLTGKLGEIQVTNNNLPESEVHAVINPLDTNNIVIAPIRSNNVFPYVFCPILYSRDFGQTWNESTFQTLPAGTDYSVVGGGDPVMAFDSNGILYLTWINLYYKGTSANSFWALSWAFSTDGGATWNRSSNDTIGFSTGYSYPDNNQFNQVFDKEWIAVDISNSTFKNSLYVAYCKMTSSPASIGIFLRKKRSGYDYFETGETPVSGSSFQDVQFCSVAVDPIGSIHVIFYGSQDNKVTYQLWHTVSTDGGNTFNMPVKITNFKKTISIKGITDSRLYPAPQIAIDNSSSFYSGYLYVTFTAMGVNYYTFSGSDVYFTYSADNGKTWSIPKILNDDPKNVIKDQFYSSITVNPKGTVIISWYDGRNSTNSNLKNDNISYCMAYSFDGGQTFTRNFFVSSIPTDFQTIRLQNGTFGIGEYNQVISTGGYAIPVWADGRKGNGDLDIYASVFPISLNPSRKNRKFTGHRQNNYFFSIPTADIR